VFLLGLADTIKAIFPPFPIPGFSPNFTGSDLGQQDVDWIDVFQAITPTDSLVYVSTERYTTSVSYC